jgi:hypothetical protein
MKMNKKVLIVLLILLLAGGGIVFAQSGLGNGLLGLDSLPEIEEELDGRKLGEEVSELARDREVDLDEILPEEALQSENDKNEKDERSAVAEAVHKVLGGGVTPADGEAFGQAVSEKAQAGGLGQAVSNAAREANGSIGKGASSR